MQPAPVFGRRSTAPARVAPRAVVAAPASEHAAFFAAARAELEPDAPARVVPRSVRAAAIAGFVVGCSLVGLDVTQAGASLRAMSGGMLSAETTPRLVPLVIAFGLFGGARSAMTILLVAHAVLRRIGATSHVAYALGGGAVALAVSAATMTLANAGVPYAASLAPHGLAIDAATGVGAGFLYRVFAGAKGAGS